MNSNNLFKTCVITLFVITPCFLVKASGLPEKIIVATEIGEDSGELSESPPRALQKLLSELGVTIEYFRCPWARCLLAIQNGDADLLDKLYFTEKRKSYIAYLQPAYQKHTSTFQFYSRINSGVEIGSIADLNNLSIGVIRSAVYFPDFDQNKKIIKSPQSHLSNLILMTARGRIDAMIAAPEDSYDHILTFPGGELLEPHPFEHVYTQEMFIGVSRKSPWLNYQALLNSKLKAQLEDKQ